MIFYDEIEDLQDSVKRIEVNLAKTNCSETF